MDNNFKVLMALMGLEIGGAETHVLELCKALNRRGVTVYVASNGGAYESELTQLGIKHFHVPMYNKQLKNLFVSYGRLKKIITEQDIRLVHAHGRIPAFLCGLLKRKLNFRFVTTAHLNFKTNFPYNILSDWGEKSLAVSADIKEYLIRNYKMNPDDILLTINGIDTDKFSPDVNSDDIISEFGFKKDTFKIVSTSRMDKDRSLVALRIIECAEELYAHNPKLEIIIVGGGDDFEHVSRKAEAVNKRLGFRLITLTGNRIDINKFLSLADIYVNVSRGVLEAMATAKPCVVAGNQGYIGIFDSSRLEICEDTNFCCRGCEDTTHERIKRDIISLMNMDADSRDALGRYGREIIISRYSLERMAEDALKLYALCARSSRSTDVLISGYYGFKNHGDEAVLKAIIDSLRAKDPLLSITILSMRPKLTSATHGVRAINRYNFPLIYRELKRTNLLITGGGSLIQDLTSTRSLIYYLSIIEMALRTGTKTMLFANGIGPLNQEKNKERASRVLNKIELITLRDERSIEVLHELGVKNVPIHFTADIAFSLTPSDPSAGARRLKAMGVNGKYFCIAIRSWKNLIDNFESCISAFADFICDTYGITPVFIPMQPTNDEDISRRVLALMRNRGYFFGTSYDLDEILGTISGAEFALGMRLHTLVYAAKAGVPVIGLVYDPKVMVMMEILGQEFYMNVEQLDLDKLKKYAQELLASRQKISAIITSAAEDAGARALRNTTLAYELLIKREF